jgi:leucyl aminopeptidase
LADTYSQPLAGIKIEIAVPEPGRLAVEFKTASEKPALGEPGKQPGSVLLTSRPDGRLALVVSLGLPGKLNAESLRQAGGGLANYLLNNSVNEAQISLGALDETGIDQAETAFLEGLLLGSFRFDRYKSGEKATSSATIFLATQQNSEDLKAKLDHVEKVAAAVNLAREWAHEPANVINPVTLAQRVSDLGERHDLKVTVIDDKALTAMKAGAIVAVGKGSKTPSRLILIEYSGTEVDAQPLVLVGKSITFDTGGYSIKDTANIQGMKYDKSGAMAVIGIVLAAAELKLKTPVVGVIAAAENMISADSYRPDDILTTLSGKTVEIISTDAEGRLVLADALTYAQQQFQPRAMIDFATLTGGVVVALGKVRAGIMANNDALAASLFEAGERTHERLWRLPLDEDYEQQIKGDDGDIKNSGGREASAIIGGTFLKQFVTQNVPWAHIDIAGMADTSKELPYCQKGATGFGVRLILDYLDHLE